MLSAQDCLHDLERLSHENSSDTRREMLRRVTDLFFATEEQREPDDTDVFGSAMDRLAYALEAEARIELSSRLAESSKAPRQLLMRMANDEIDVARPLLEQSQCLTDEDLVAIANSTSQDHLMAMTKRESLSPSVTDVIVERGDDDVVESVAQNRGASFSEQAYDLLTNRCASSEAIHEAISGRDDLPEDFLEIVKAKVAKKLVSEIENKKIDISEDDIHSVVDAKVSEVSDARTKEDKMREAFADQHKKKAFEEEDIINFARARKIEETVEVLALITKLESSMVRHCLLEADLAALGILCKASDFKDNTYASLLQLRLTIKGMASNLAITEMKRYQNLTTASAQRVLRFLKVRLTASADN